jgi:mannose-1-phosphate guanylyltransferase
MKITFTIMAGGKGTRFWPASTETCPKQFISITGDGLTMLQKTYNRIKPLCNDEDIFIVTNKNYKTLVSEQLPNVPGENVICEPVGRNTAPAVAVSALLTKIKFGDAINVVLPSDHIILDEENFREIILRAAKLADEENALLTLGIRPNYPETGYGYIEYDKAKTVGTANKAVRFKEKPDKGTAEKYIEAGNFLWNSGMFIWKNTVITEEIRRYLHDYTNLLETIRRYPDFHKGIKEIFPMFRSESIDYGIMEKSENILVIPCSFGWDDAGSWNALFRINKTDADNNFLKGNIQTINCKNTVVYSTTQKKIAVIGLDSVIIADTDEAILVCSTGETDKIKEL